MGVWGRPERLHHNFPRNIITACHHVIPCSTEKYQPGFDQNKALREGATWAHNYYLTERNEIFLLDNVVKQFSPRLQSYCEIS